MNWTFTLQERKFPGT